jgi:hypothetical protein
MYGRKSGSGYHSLIGAPREKTRHLEALQSDALQFLGNQYFDQRLPGNTQALREA